MTTQALSDRISALSVSLKQTSTLIQKLSTLQPSSTLLESAQTVGAATNPDDDIPNVDELRNDLGAEIADNLRQAEDELENLKMDVEDVVVPGGTAAAVGGRRTLTPRASERIQEIARLNAGCARLTEDIRLGRARFRHAQLRAKRNLDLAAEKERANYLASLRAAALATQSPPSIPNPDTEPNSSKETQQPLAALQATLFGNRRGGSGVGSKRDANATQSDMLLSASADVTASLKRTHALLASELSRSRYAHETLEESNAALKELNERYMGLDDLLKNSRNLLRTLLYSNKSDTWYLQTAMYLLAATLGWLIFRRLLYGPILYLLIYPARFALWLLTIFTAPIIRLISQPLTPNSTASISRPPLKIMPSASNRPPPIHSAYAPAGVPVGAGGDGAKAAARSLSDVVGSMIDEAQAVAAAGFTDARSAALAYATGQPSTDQQQQHQDQQTHQEEESNVQEEEGRGDRRGDGQPLPQRDEATQPRNPKKRAMEVSEEQMQRERRDEL